MTRMSPRLAADRLVLTCSNAGRRPAWRGIYPRSATFRPLPVYILPVCRMALCGVSPGPSLHDSADRTTRL